MGSAHARPHAPQFVTLVAVFTQTVPQYDASLMEPVCADLRARGWEVVNVEYRRGEEMIAEEHRHDG